MKDKSTQSPARRSFLKSLPPLALLYLQKANAQTTTKQDSLLYPDVEPNKDLIFPKDHGGHPDYRTEWWYLTAWLESKQGPLGLQITFFRSRTPYARNNPSRFAPKQLLLAHAALALPEKGRLLHDQQAWRVDDNIAKYSEDDTNLTIGMPNKQWQMTRTNTDQININVNANEFTFNITATPPPNIKQPVLQGNKGFSQKGAMPKQSSYYYSRPQLQITGEYQTAKTTTPIAGTGWLDHEWSSELMSNQAAGWDWVGLNFDDGSALMAFQMRDKNGGALKTAARFINIENGRRKEQELSPMFTPQRYWQSPRTDARYPVSMRLQVGLLDLIIEPLFDDQELDSRGSTGIIYWEGAVQVWDQKAVAKNGSKSGNRIANGYLELTGYAGEIVM